MAILYPQRTRILHTGTKIHASKHNNVSHACHRRVPVPCVTHLG